MSFFFLAHPVHSTFCMHMYGCELWNITNSDVDKFYVAWRKIKRRIWKSSYLIHTLISN